MNANPFTKAVLDTGLITQAQLDEMRRLKAPNLTPESTLSDAVESVEEVVGVLNKTLQSEGLIIMRETDLEAIRMYTATAKAGVLHVEIEDQQTDIDVTFGRTPTGEYIIPWRSESILEVMVHPGTYLQDKADGYTDRIYFKAVRELFFGQQKAFMACVPV